LNWNQDDFTYFALNVTGGRIYQRLLFNNPLDFGLDNDKEHFVCTLPVAAPEIVKDKGECSLQRCYKFKRDSSVSLYLDKTLRAKIIGDMVEALLDSM